MSFFFFNRISLVGLSKKVIGSDVYDDIIPAVMSRAKETNGFFFHMLEYQNINVYLPSPKNFTRSTI